MLKTIVLAVILVVAADIASNVSAIRYAEIKPIRFPGSIRLPISNQGITKSISQTFGIYFSRKSIEIIESANSFDSNLLPSNQEEVILCDVLGLAITDPSARSLIESELKQTSSTNIEGISSGSSFLFNRDGGLYDNLPYQWGSNENNKKELYDYISKYDNAKRLRSGGMKIGTMSSIQAVRYAIEDTLGCQIMGLLVEKSDEIDNGSVILGGSILLSKSNDESSYAPATSILSRITSSSTNDDLGEGDSMLVDCYLDELILLSLALETPVFIADDLMDELSNDARMTSNQDQENNLVVIEGPICQGRSESSQSQKRKQSSSSSNPIPVAWEVYDPQLFFKWSSLDKRAILRSSGVKKLPRPREGEQPLDEMLLDLMDDATRNEIRRLNLIRRSRPGNFDDRVDNDGPGNNVDSLTRQELLQKIGESIEKGETEKAISLRSRFMMLTSLRADPTQPSGSYDRYLDQDDWYLAARRKSMGL